MPHLVHRLSPPSKAIPAASILSRSRQTASKLYLAQLITPFAFGMFQVVRPLDHLLRAILIMCALWHSRQTGRNVYLVQMITPFAFGILQVVSPLDHLSRTTPLCLLSHSPQTARK